MHASTLPPCPQCAEPYAYEQGALLVCPMCGHEWSAEEVESATAEAQPVTRDAVGNILADGDNVVVVSDLKVRGGGGGVVKIGTKVRGIQLITDGIGDHDIDATVPGFGRMQLKSSVVRKTT